LTTERKIFEKRKEERKGRPFTSRQSSIPIRKRSSTQGREPPKKILRSREKKKKS